MPVLFKKTLLTEELSFRLVRNLSEKEGFPTRFTCGNDRVLISLDVFLRWVLIMGSRKQKKQAFLTEHPLCCFCGGQTRSAEPDHIPSRAIFFKRQWPEGYEFPACQQCNTISRYDEQIVAMLSRLYPGPDTAEKAREVHESIRAVAYNHPEILEEMKAQPEQV